MKLAGPAKQLRILRDTIPAVLAAADEEARVNAILDAIEELGGNYRSTVHFSMSCAC